MSQLRPTVVPMGLFERFFAILFKIFADLCFSAISQQHFCHF
ncbi:hypothetical protein PAUR_a0216 [Pseudoalteromonas aurantia 208]|uniref:Orphan protein n=1 Tax=Pseudoalteromonas aurantia 208 TaxID=1314867 RepID=A0ABR9E7I4_9GAMM|nr:hypothetical protein [Pseudoalteromonas aurantia 208]